MNKSLRQAGNVISLPRLAAGGVVVTLLLAVVYFTSLRDPSDGVSAATLVDTPPAAGIEQAGVELGDLAPDFEISDPEGERLRLSDLRGRPVLINFWARWCTSCLSEMPEIKDLQAQQGGFEVMAVNAGESRDEALEFIEFLDAPFNYGLDVDLTVADAYGVYGLPLTVFVDAAGIVRGVYRGHADRPRLEALAQAAIAGQPVGDLGSSLRFITRIPRPKEVTVIARGEGETVLLSRSLRCDDVYCANTAVDEAAFVQGVHESSIDRSGELPALTLQHEPGERERIVEAVVGLLFRLQDPIYEPSQEFTITYQDS